MLTVIIFKDSSKDFVNKYRTLFEPYLDSGQIAFCLWDERGATMQTALGNLPGIVKGAEKWRAIVVLPLSANEFTPPGEASDSENPFDYLCNSSMNPEVVESDIPVIRLAQMLGGVPRPARHFINEWVSDRELAVRKQEDDAFLKEQEDRWNTLCDKYSFSGDLPESLYLLAAKTPARPAVPPSFESDRLKRYETDSSLFVERNRYPDRARFLIQDCARPGNVHYEEDLFGFWMTALTLAINDMPSGTLEAYKLYRAEAVVDRKRVHEVLSSYYNRLGGVLFYANRQIHSMGQAEEEIPDDTDLPFLDVTIPLQFGAYDEDGLFISAHRIGFAGDCPVPEEPWWHEAVRNSRSAAGKILRSVGIILDKASKNCSFLSRPADDEIRALNEYQRAMLEEKLALMEEDILTFQTSALLPVQWYAEQGRRAEREASTRMRKRMTRTMTIAVSLICLMVYIAGFVPDFILQFGRGRDFRAVAGICGLGVAGMLVAGVVCLLHFRNQVIQSIIRYNRVTRTLAERIESSGERFSSYLSDCSTYMRGRGLLQKLDEQEQIVKDGLLMLTDHVNQLEVQMKNIENWLLDFSLTPLEDNGEFAGKIDFDFEIRPERNSQYLIQLDMFDLKIESPDGSICQAPYPFVTGLDLVRIPVFERNYRRDPVTSRD